MTTLRQGQRRQSLCFHAHTVCIKCDAYLVLIYWMISNNPNEMLQQVYLSVKKRNQLQRHKLVTLCVSKFQLAELCELCASLQPI